MSDCEIPQAPKGVLRAVDTDPDNTVPSVLLRVVKGGPGVLHQLRVQHGHSPDGDPLPPAA